jgi:hypothetical protein
MTNSPFDFPQATVDVPATPQEPTPPVDYVYVEMPDGTYKAVPRSEVTPRTSTQDSPAVVANKEPEAEYYVWLADGSVERVKESDLPSGHGSNNPFGHWQRKDKVLSVVGVYPVETTVGA